MGLSTKLSVTANYTKQSKHIHITPYVAWSLSLFGHIARLDDGADAKKILTALPPQDWKRPPGRPQITWMKNSPK